MVGASGDAWGDGLARFGEGVLEAGFLRGAGGGLAGSGKGCRVKSHSVN